MPDYLPTADAELIAWLQNFTTYANANLAALGLVAADMTPVTTAFTALQSAFNANNAAQAAAQAARQTKDTNRTTAEVVTRALARRLQAAPAVTDTQRQALGLPVRDKQPTSKTAPTTRPTLEINTAQRLQHTLAFRNEGASKSSAKPKGVLGCEIWVKVGATPPADPSELRFLALDTATPYIALYTGADAGKPAHYMARWLNTQGEPGPWSEVVSATVTG